MKSRVVMMALLCLVLVFHGALAATDPAEVSGLTYNGSDQKLLTAAGEHLTVSVPLIFEVDHFQLHLLDLLRYCSSK